jgi:hypothetical protein
MGVDDLGQPLAAAPGGSAAAPGWSRYAWGGRAQEYAVHFRWFPPGRRHDETTLAVADLADPGFLRARWTVGNATLVVTEPVPGSILWAEAVQQWAYTN